MWMSPLTCGGNALVMSGSWISRGSGRRGLNTWDEAAAEGDNIPAGSTFALACGSACRDGEHCSARRRGVREHFWRCAAYPEGETGIPLIVRMVNVPVSLPEGVLSSGKGDSGAVVIKPVVMHSR